MQIAQLGAPYPEGYGIALVAHSGGYGAQAHAGLVTIRDEICRPGMRLGVELLDPGGLLSQVTMAVLERAG